MFGYRLLRHWNCMRPQAHLKCCWAKAKAKATDKAPLGHKTEKLSESLEF